MKKPYLSWLGVTLSVVLTSISGCAADSQTSSDEPNAQQGEVEFTGPYAEDFRMIYDSSDSEFVRQALADEKISAAEVQEAKNRITRCFEDAGAIQVEFQGDGGAMSVGYDQNNWPEPAKEQEIATKCQLPELHILTLNRMTAENPDNVDLTEEQYKCLIARAIVEQSTTLDEFAKMAAEDGVSSVLDNLEGNQDQIDLAIACINDPLRQDY